MEERDDFRSHMKAAAARFDNSRGQCPAEEELIAHYRGELDPALREQVESHLMQCAVCRERLLDIKDFLDPARDGEDPVTPADVDRQWNLLSRRMGTGEKPLARIRSLQPRSMPALAACLAVALALSLMWTVQRDFGSQRQETAAQQRLREMEEENRKLQRQIEAGRQQIAQLQQPRLNTPVHDVFSSQSLARSAGAANVNRIEVATGTPFTLILNGEGLRALPDYAVEILNNQDQSVWKSPGLKRGSLGNFVMTLPGGFLPDGEYRIRLSGRTDRGYERIADYAISLKTRP